jgi:mannosyltransferase OCH1-like enzyme
VRSVGRLWLQIFKNREIKYKFVILLLLVRESKDDYFGGLMKKFNSALVIFALAYMPMISAMYPIPAVPFKQSMNYHSQFNPSHLNTQKDWDILTQTYEDFKKYSKNAHTRYLIPRLIHLISLQEGNLSRECQKRIKKCKDLHPGWKMKVWTKANIASLKMKNRKAFQNARTLDAKTAIATYEILNNFGGLCMSPNFECVKAFDTLHQSCEFYTGVSPSSSHVALLPNLIGCKAHHPIISRCIYAIGASNAQAKPLTPAQQLTQSFIQSASQFQGRAIALPVSFFNTSPYATMDSVQPETFAFYHYEP